jgi:hypothetical protein
MEQSQPPVVPAKPGAPPPVPSDRSRRHVQRFTNENNESESTPLVVASKPESESTSLVDTSEPSTEEIEHVDKDPTLEQGALFDNSELFSKVPSESSEPSKLTGKSLSQVDPMMKELEGFEDKDQKGLLDKVFKEYDENNEQISPRTILSNIKSIYERLEIIRRKRITREPDTPYEINNGSLKITIHIINLISKDLENDSNNMDMRKKLVICLYTLRVIIFNLIEIIIPDSTSDLDDGIVISMFSELKISNGLSAEESDDFKTIASDLMNNIKMNISVREKAVELKRIYKELLTPLYIRLTTPETSVEITPASGINKGSIPPGSGTSLNNVTGTSLPSVTGLEEPLRQSVARSGRSGSSYLSGRPGSLSGKDSAALVAAAEKIKNGSVPPPPPRPSIPTSITTQSGDSNILGPFKKGGKSRKRKSRSRRSTRKKSRKSSRRRTRQ